MKLKPLYTVVVRYHDKVTHEEHYKSMKKAVEAAILMEEYYDTSSVVILMQHPFFDLGQWGYQVETVYHNSFERVRNGTC